MQAHDQSGKKKIHLMNSIMQHPKLSRTLSDAMRAPIGSTKRKHVKSIVSVLNKVYENHDGAGGPGDPFATSTSPFAGMTLSPDGQLGTGTTTPQNTFVIPAAPSPFSQSFSSNFNTGTPSTPATSGSTPSLYSALNPTYKPPQTSSLQGPNGIIQSSWYPTPGSGLMSLNGPSTKMENTAAPVLDASDLVKNGMQFGSGPSLDLNAAVNSGGLSWDSGKPPALQSTVDSTTQTGQQTGPQTGTQQGGSQSSGLSYSGSGDIGLSGGDTGGSTAAPGSLEAAAQDAANKNLGGATFAMKAMQDKNLLKQLYPGVPDDQLPVGASLTSQINDLSKMLKNEYHLDSLQSQLTQKINAGVSLPNDITAYIRGKDQVIGHIDSMLQDVQNKLPNLDLNDPMQSATMKNYQNYLLIMKGRANQRYVDWANDSINQFNAQTTAIQNAYNTAKDLYTSDFTTKSAAKQEDYNRTYSVLTDLYNNISAAPDKELQRQMLEAQLTAAKQSIITSALQAAQIDAQNAAVNTGGGASLMSAITGGMFTPEESMKAFDFVTKAFTDSKGAMNTGLSIDSILANTAKMNLPASAVLFAYSNILSQKINSATDMSEVNRMKEQLDNLFSRSDIQELMQKYPGSSFSILQNESQQWVQNATKKQISTNADLYKAALSDLFPSGFLGIGGRNTLIDKAKWLENHKDLPATVLSQIYDRVKSFVDASPNNQKDIIEAIYNGSQGNPAYISDATTGDTLATILTGG